MQIVELFSNPRCHRYAASRFSFAYIFSLGCKFVAIVVPFFLCYAPQKPNGKSTFGGIWLKEKTYREQPEVHFQHKVYLIAQAIDTSKNIPKEIFYSSLDSVNHLRSDTFRTATVRTREIDNNYDDIMDTFKLFIELPLENNEEIFSVKILLFFDYRLQNHVKIDMDSLVYISRDSGLPGSTYSTRGDLVLKQATPLAIRKTFSTLYNDQVLMDTKKASTIASRANIHRLIERYESRLFSTDYAERFPIWMRSHRDPAETNKMMEDQVFSVFITVNIPIQEILYIPTLQEVLREAWVRYLSVLIVVVILLRQLCFVVYANQLVETILISDP